MPDEFPDRRLPAIDAGPDHDPFEPPELPDELIDELLAGARTPEEITGPDGLLSRLTKRLVERAMDAELSEHLGYERGQAPPGGVGNARNGMTPKTVHTEHGSVRLMFVRHGLALAGVGVLFRLGGAFALTRWMEKMLFGVRGGRCWRARRGPRR